MSYAAAPSAGSGTAPGRAGYSNRPPSGPVTSHPPGFPWLRASASSRIRYAPAPPLAMPAPMPSFPVPSLAAPAPLFPAPLFPAPLFPAPLVPRALVPRAASRVPTPDVLRTPDSQPHDPIDDDGRPCSYTSVQLCSQA